jgi:hypothetical protein
MSTPTPIRIPVCNADGVIVERVDAARARRLFFAKNATLVHRRNGELVRILLASTGDDTARRFLKANPKKYTFLERSEDMPKGVHTLRHLPDSTQSLYCTVRTDCLKAA